MKVIAFNCSPKAEKANTSLILTPFLQGMEEAGARVELFFTKKLQIRPCAGDLHCWFQKPGVCIHKDDMQMLYPRLREADIWVFGTPVYFDGVSGPMKNLIDRMVPLILPFVELRGGHCAHALREGTRTGRVVLVSNCGFWEKDNFDPLITHMKAYCRTIGREFAGALIRPCGDTFRGLLDLGRPVDDILEAAGEAGRQLIAEGQMSGDILDIISREIMPLDRFVKGSNRVCQQFLDALEKEEG
ncbi:MAG: flavodoxin family protein [Deltaproteobacteria bacterium]|nr:flavodoxin family protein [Deltaproteobacteria bacterium]